MLKNKFKLTMAVAMSAMFLLAPISVKAESNDLNNFGAPAGFDWEAERARQKAGFEKFERENADKIYKKADLLALFEKLNKENAEEVKEKSDIQMPAGYDREAELARQRAGFEKFEREHADQIHKKSEINAINTCFPSNIKPGQPLVTKDGVLGDLIGHAGIVINANDTIEAHPGQGVHYGTANDWFSKDTLFILSSKDTSDMSAAADYTRNQIGKPYNINFFDHITTDSFYCSQLVWRSYIDNLGIDLCPGAWSIVSPNDILCSSRLNVDFAFN